jgi:hypothetical protein
MLLKEAAKCQSLVKEPERHRSVLAETQGWLQRVRDEKDVVQLEKNKQEALLRDLQTQIIRSPLPSNIAPRLQQTIIPPTKLPPLSPPPSIPPLPTPRSNATSTPSPLTMINSMASSQELNPDSPATPTTSLAPPLHGSDIPVVDPKLIQQLDQQTRTIGEQAAMIKTPSKQPIHYGSDLQTHMDEVIRLENFLADLEKNRTHSALFGRSSQPYTRLTIVSLLS